MINTFINLPERINGILNNWDTFEDELCEHYVQEIDWLINTANLDNVNDKELELIKIADQKLIEMSECMKKTIGINYRSIFGRL